MKKRLQITLGAAAGLSLFASFLAPVQAQAQQQEQQRPFDLGRLGKLVHPDVSPQERARQGIEFLREGTSRPTQTYPGLGGPITHEYILAQIVHSIGGPFGTHVEPAVDREVLWKEYRTTAPGEYRDVLALTLAWAGDARVGEKVAAYLENVKHDQSLRTKAAVGLGFLQDKQYVPLLVSVMRNDPQYLSRRTRDGAEKPVEERRYAVRLAARGALLNLQNKGVEIGEAAREAMKAASTRVTVPAAER